jgi:hypothetical protein
MVESKFNYGNINGLLDPSNPELYDEDGCYLPEDTDGDAPVNFEWKSGPVQTYEWSSSSTSPGEGYSWSSSTPGEAYSWSSSTPGEG